MKIDRIDHFVLTVKSIDKTCEFYTNLLGMEELTFAGGRRALRFGNQKINLHEAGAELLPRAVNPTPGSGDFCLISAEPLNVLISALERSGIEIEQGPDERSGATGPIRSVYFRDPDDNLVEVSEYLQAD